MKLKPFTLQDIEEKTRWGGFTVSLEANVILQVKKSDSRPKNEALKTLLENATVSNPAGWGLEHFGYTDLEAGMTLATLRKRWEDGRGPHRLKNMPWTEVIAEEIWRIVTARPTNLTWEPFLSLKDNMPGLWVYPIVYRFHVHPSGRYDFDLLVIQTRTPSEVEQDPGVLGADPGPVG